MSMLNRVRRLEITKEAKPTHCVCEGRNGIGVVYKELEHSENMLQENPRNETDKHCGICGRPLYSTVVVIEYV